MEKRKLKAVTITNEMNLPIAVKMKPSLATNLNNWLETALKNQWEIKHIINHAPKESITIIYEYQEEENV